MAQDLEYLGYVTEEDLQKPFAHFLNPELPPLTPQCIEALQRGPRPPELLDSVTAISVLQEDGYRPVETGYALTNSGGMIVSCFHDMPGVLPAMWAWWFAWHGNEGQRYKLWHPLAHVAAMWDDGQGYTGEYIGRTSNVTEYIGGKCMKVSIRFVPPASVGLDEHLLAEKGEVAICAKGVQRRVLTTEVGTFVHHLRPTATGCEMRSRFWLGGTYVRPANVVTHTVAKFLSRTEQDAIAMLVHNAEEMAHLATFLPQLYAEFGAAEFDA